MSFSNIGLKLKDISDRYWNLPIETLIDILQSNSKGLSSVEYVARLNYFGANILKPTKELNKLIKFLLQFKNPIILLLLFSAIFSIFLGDPIDAIIIFIILIFSSFLGFWQEMKATDAVSKLISLIKLKVSVLRDNQLQITTIDEIVPGDIIILNAGKNVPADCIILESKDLYVNEAALTGESFPVAKSKEIINIETPFNQRTNVLYMGTHIISGEAKALVIFTGKQTEFGKISEDLKLRPPETEFERGIRRFGNFIIQISSFLLISIFFVNVLLNRSFIDSILFALALAIGLTPQLLPAIISIILAKGAKNMINVKVIVKRLNSIENYGNMNILCSDKTGTLTEGIVKIKDALNVENKDDETVLFYSYLNSKFQSAYENPIDDAIINFKPFDISTYDKIDEIPYDFVRKRLSVILCQESKYFMVTKGTVINILDICKFVQRSDNKIDDINDWKDNILKMYESISNQGFRLLGISSRELPNPNIEFRNYENEMIFLGFLVLYDPPKSGLIHTIENLKKLGINLKIITGDNKFITSSIAKQIGLFKDEIFNPETLTGSELRKMSDEALRIQVKNTDLFAEVEPNQKERIILALKKTGNVVGYLGDGINDATALHSADVGISVESAVDVAKEAADIVLLEKDLDVIIEGVIEGRKTFSNTLKYIFMTISANFGNMLSMAGASLLIPFLPLMPYQILLINLMTDLPAINIASDNVDTDQIEKPRKWDIKKIRHFMLIFGIVSSLFDYLTFIILIYILKSTPEQFRTVWFLESVLTELLIMIVIRTKNAFYKSKPSKTLIISIVIVIIIAFVIPYTPLNSVLNFIPLSFLYLTIPIIIAIGYTFLTELVKKYFYLKYPE